MRLTSIVGPLCLLLVAGCGTYSVRSDRIIQPMSATVETTDLPGIGLVNSVEIGESLVRKERVSVVPAINLQSVFTTQSEWMGNKFTVAVRPGVYVRVGIDSSGTYYASQGDNFQIDGKPAGRGGIYVPTTNTAATEVFTFNPLGKLIVYPLPRIAFAATKQSSPALGGFRRELVYSGVSKGTVSILYREYLNDLARPAFSQDLKYDLSDGSTIGYKGARFEIIQATNIAIQYRIIKSID